MRDTTITLYSIDELKEETQQKIFEKHRHINVDYGGWHDWIFEDWYIKLKNLGYKDVKIYYSGFGSQGDGACFIANIDIEKWIVSHKKKAEFRALLKWQKEYGDVTAYIKHNYRYYFASSTEVCVDENNWSAANNVQQQLGKLEEYIKKEREELGNEIYKALEDAYFDLISDESIVEMLKVNEYEFFEDGRKF
jgi:hypothetical protein